MRGAFLPPSPSIGADDMSTIPLDCARAMAMVAFPCPPLPVLGSRMEDGASAVLNSHDVLCTLMATAFKMGDAGVNARREARQRELEMRYREAVAAGMGDFDRVYGAMALFTHEYIQSYVLHDMPIRVLELDRATPAIRAQIQGYTRARAMMLGGAPSGDLPPGDLRSCVRECAALLDGGVGGAEPLHAGVAAVAGQE